MDNWNIKYLQDNHRDFQKSGDLITILPEIKIELSPLVILTGPSGSGKTTIAFELEKLNPLFKKVKTCTTRPPRDEEKSNDPYNRFTKAEFEDQIKKGYFYEYAIYNDNYYGTRRQDIESLSGHIPVLSIEKIGAQNIKKNSPKNFTLIDFFINTENSETLRNYHLSRCSDPAKFENRLAFSIENDIPHILDSNYIIINQPNKLQESCRLISNIVLPHFHS